jgi:hypothetical protein
VQNTGGLVGGALAPIVTGVFVEATHSFAGALAATALAALAGAAVYAFAVRRPIEVDDSRAPPPSGGRRHGRP